MFSLTNLINYLFKYLYTNKKMGILKVGLGIDQYLKVNIWMEKEMEKEKNMKMEN